MAIENLAVTFMIWMGIALAGGVFIIISSIGSYLLWRLMRYKIRVDIYEKVGDKNFICFSDFAREVVNFDDNGKRKTFLRLLKGLKGMKKIPLPESHVYIPQGMRKKLNLVYKDSIMTPLPITENSDPQLTFDPKDMLKVLYSWDQDYSENLETHKTGSGFWDRWGNQISWLILIFTQFILFLILITQQSGGGGSLPQVIQ